MPPKKLIDYSNREWVTVNTSLPNCDPRWTYFDRSDKTKEEDTSSTNRGLARCQFCQATMDGRLDRMAAHITGSCQLITKEQMTNYSRIVAAKAKPDEAVDDSSSVFPRKGVGLYVRRGISKQEAKVYHEHLASALVTGNISPRFVENIEFKEAQEYLGSIVGVTFKATTIEDIANAETRLWTRLVLEEYTKVDEDYAKTICLDNWRDSANQSHEAIVLDKRGDKNFHKFFYDTLLSEGTRKTSQHLYEMLNASLLKMSQDAWDRVAAMCTDSPSAMVKLRSIVVQEHPHVIILGCVLHVLSLLTKDCLQFQQFADNMVANMALVLFFKRSEIWSEKFSFYGTTRLVVFIKTR